MSFKPNSAIAATVLAIALLASCFATANEVRSHQGVVVTRSELASKAGTEVMAQGGNAVDAIVAAGFALAVTHPAAGNIGGGGFMVIRLADGTLFANDHREIAPAAAFRDMFLDADGDYNPRKALRSHQASGVPGSVAGLLTVHEKFGVLSREQVMAAGIRLAKEGFPLTEDLARQFSGRKNQWLKSAGAKKVFLKPDESTYESGELFVQADLAVTLERISDQGRDGFYKGKTAQLIVEEMKRGSGLITLDDLESYESVWREPIVGDYRGYQVVSMPPPSSGGVLLVQMLNMLEPFDLSELGVATSSSMHLIVEIERRAYADRAVHLGDSDFYPVPIALLTNKDYALSRFKNFDSNKRSPSRGIAAGNLSVESEETTHLSAIDAEGNAVAYTTTLNSGYGSGIVVQGAGFLLNNEMDDFSSKPGVPNQFGLIGAEANAIEPKKRMLSSMTPTIVVHDNKPVIVTGSPGGSTIITTVLQVVTNVLDHGMTLNDAVAQPRFHHQWLPDVVTLERNGFSTAVVEELQELDHEITYRNAIGDANTAGSRDGWIIGVSDPRNTGYASGLLDPPQEKETVESPSR